jgi:transcriptional regulator with GAF, ATPase, and Fis domain
MKQDTPTPGGLFEADERTLKRNSPSLVSQQSRGCLLYISEGLPSDQGRSARILGGPAFIGRDPGCDLVLDDRNVSRRHVRIEMSAMGVAVEDIGSTNGIEYLGRRIERATLGFGARIKVGDTAIDLLPLRHDTSLPLARRDRYGELLGGSLPMRRLYTLLEALQASTVPVLLQGETGTGKELAARAIHENSPRATQPFVIIDCGTVPDGLMESELFGHKKGAFTGATADRAGVFESAHSGTVFLDEFGELPLNLQPKLLRVLETGQLRRIGESRTRQVEVRIITATKRNLEQEVADGRFRDDLFYRVAVVRIDMPPLRERREDIPLLASSLAHRLGLPRDQQLAPELMESLLHRTWPGNVRELRNVVQQAMAFGQLAPRVDTPKSDGPAGVNAAGSEATRGGPPSAGSSLSEMPPLSTPAGGASMRIPESPEPPEPQEPQELQEPQEPQEPQQPSESLGSLKALDARAHESVNEYAIRLSLPVFDIPFSEARSQVIEGFERAYLTRLLTRAGGNLSEASRLSGTDRSYLRRLLKKYDLH